MENATKCKMEGCDNERRNGFDTCTSCYHVMSNIESFLKKEGGMKYLKFILYKKYQLRVLQ